MYIEKGRGGYYVISESGKPLGGPYPTYAKAYVRREQILYFLRQNEVREHLKGIDS